MQFTKKGSTNNGSRATPITIENLIRSSATPKVFTNTHSFRSRKSMDNERLLLEPIWEYMIFYNGVEVYWFDSEMPYYITDENIPATIGQCEEIVRQTYKQLQSSWENRKVNEVNFFPSVLDLTNEALELAAEDLMKTLDDEL